MLIYNRPKPFTYKAIEYLPPIRSEGIKSTWHFSLNMIKRCIPLFNHCQSNHDVETLLTKARVIGIDDKSDTESEEFVIRFRDRKAAHDFIDRLNDYIEKKWKLFSKTYDQK